METAQKWDRSSADCQRVFQDGINDYNRGLLAFFQDNGMLWPGCRVLDIGCGVGKYGAYLAALGCAVTLTDISPRMLDYARENMAAFHTPWETLLCDFGEVSPTHPLLSGGFDLTISTMSPAIHDLATIRKMSALTRGWCFTANFVSWEQPLRDRFYRALGMDCAAALPDASGRASELIQAVSAAGYTPRIQYVPYAWSDDRAPAEAARYLLQREDVPAEPSGELLAQAERAAMALADARGLFVDTVNTQVQWLYWKTEGD